MRARHPSARPNPECDSHGSFLEMLHGRSSLTRCSSPILVAAAKRLPESPRADLWKTFVVFVFVSCAPFRKVRPVTASRFGADRSSSDTGSRRRSTRLDLDVVTGECFGLLGPNGAGKTTTVEILEGLNQPDSGTVTLFDIAWREGGSGASRALRRAASGDPARRQAQRRRGVRLFRSFYREGHSRGRAHRACSTSVRNATSTIRGFPVGEAARRASAARSSEIRTSSFSTSRRPASIRARGGSLWGVVERFRAEGGTVLITTHYMEEATALCDRIAIMDHGKIIAADTPRSAR